MSESKTQVIKCKVSELIHADWNYKTDGTDEQIETLANAITNAGSCGVLAVREVSREGKNFLEVMDGNHRLTAIRKIGWHEVAIENFGPLTQAQAIILTRQRNEQWFADDKLKLAGLFTDFVFPEFDKDALAGILPESLEQLNIYEEMAALDWQDTIPREDEPSGESAPSTQKYINIKVDEEVFNLWEKWLERCEEITSVDSESRAIEFAIIEALNVPEEQLQTSMAE